MVNASNSNVGYVYLTTINQSSLDINFGLPFIVSGVNTYTLSVYLELINNCGSNTTVTTSRSSFFDSVIKTF